MTTKADCPKDTGDNYAADMRALLIAEVQSFALAFTHELTAHGSINRKVFFQQPEEDE